MYGTVYQKISGIEIKNPKPFATHRRITVALLMISLFNETFQLL
jgi:hypothetical protein